MNKFARDIINARAKKIYDYYSADELAIIHKVLELFIEHPSKPGYKRQDIVYFLEQI